MIREHVDSLEISQEHVRWQKIENRLADMCYKANIFYTFMHKETNLNVIPENCPHDKILLIAIWDLIPRKSELEILNQKCIEHDKKMLVVCDSFFNDSVNMSNLTVCSDPKLLSLSSSFDQALPKTKKPNKLFSCFMHRVEPTRQSWFYFLYLHGLLDKGYVSFLLYQLRTIQPKLKQDKLNLFDANHRSGLDSLEKFNRAYLHLRNKVPFRNFEDNKNLSHFVADSKYNLVLETYAIDNDHFAVYISEKTIRSLENPCLDLIFGQHKTYDYLSKYGIEFYQPLADIDDPSWLIQQQNILRVLTGDTIDVSIDYIYEQCIHNRELFKSWYYEISSSDYFKKYIELL